MAAIIYIIALFLPVIWRALLSWVFPTGIYTVGRLSAWAIPLLVVAVQLARLGLGAGAYGRFIPFLLATFWLPQVAVIAFFVWCEKEQAKRRDTEALANPSSPQR